MENSEFPVSINNRQCIGPCYEKNKYIMHPINLTFVTNDKPFCPTNVYESKDKTGKKYTSFTDECFKATANDSENDQMDFLNPNINFNPEQFLILYYKIDNYDRTLEWLKNNNHLPLRTKLRVIECTIVKYYNNIYILDDLIINNYYLLVLDNINKIYEKIYKYIDIDSDKKKILFKETKLDINDFIVERINFIKDKLINQDEIGKFINKYLEKSKKDSVNIEKEFQKNELIKNFIIYIENKILKSIINI
jgi:hypothetical protein